MYRHIVIGETDDFVVVNKPIGIAVQGEQESLLAQLRAQWNQELYPVHRLDKGTSGVLLLAKNSDANTILSDLFRRREMDKYYLALSDKKPKKKQGAVVGDMVKSRRGAYKLLRSKENPARTSFFSFGSSTGVRYFVLRLYTGKTHQVRVALKSLGAPIIGDELYTGTPADRMYLHALELGFTFNGRRFHFSATPQSGDLFLSEDCTQWQSKHSSIQDMPWPIEG